MGLKKYLAIVFVFFVNLVVAVNSSFGAWGTSTVDSAGNVGQYTSIAVGTSGAAYISYYDTTNGDLKYATNVSGAWGTSTVDSAGDVGKYTSIAVGTSGAAYISYIDNLGAEDGRLKYATNVSGAWVTSTIDLGLPFESTSIAVGTSGAVYISYYESSNANADLEYATNVSGAWVRSTLDSAGDVGAYNSIAVGTSGAVYISYTGGSDLKYATNVSGAWVTSTLDSAGSVGLYTSIAVGTSGAVYISYYDDTNDDLKYAANPTHTAITGAASGVTTSGATLNGTANATGLSTTAYFQYGLTSGSYTGTSSTQSVSGTDNTAVSAELSGLVSSTTYYYRLANKHYTSIVYGDEASFTTSSPGGGGGEPEPVKVKLTISSASPSSGAIGVSVTTAVSATFNIYVNGSTVTTESFKLSSEGGDVSGSVATNGAKITFTPSVSLSYGTKYTATITTKVQAANAAGTTMESAYNWDFTTESKISVTPTPAASPTATPAASPSPTSAATAVPTPTATPQPSPVPSPSPTPTTPGVSGALQLSKKVAYLSGDTVVVTVADADRDASITSEDTLTTALKVTALNYYAGGDLMLDMKENAVNSGTFLATIKTGTTTTGGADSGARSNIGTFKTVQGGTATVVYTDTNPSASTTSKTLAFSSFDATLAFDRESYTIGEYAAVMFVDAEINTDHTQEETLLNHALIETSSINRAWMKLTETGADTGTFKGSIIVSGDATLDNERIQASGGDTLTVGCADKINTSGASRWAAAESRVVSTAATPIPTPTATQTPSPTFTPTATPSPSPTMTPTATPTPLYTGSISGTVSDTKNSPAESATVSIRDKGTEDGEETTTDGNGLFKFTGLAAGEYEVSARKNSSKSAKKKVTLEDGENKELTITVYTKGWKYNPANGHFYKVIKGGAWPRCNMMAGKEGVQLVCIDDKKEQQWLVRQFGGGTLYWIGLTDKDKEGVWKWVDGEKATYTNWFGSEPTDTGGSEDYAVMNWKSPGKWNDLGLQSGQKSGVTHAIIECGDEE